MVPVCDWSTTPSVVPPPVALVSRGVHRIVPVEGWWIVPPVVSVAALPAVEPKKYEPFGVELAIVSNCRKLAAAQRKRSAVEVLIEQLVALVKVTVHAVEAPLVKLPLRTVVGEQLQESDSDGIGTVELTFWQLHFEGLPGRTSLSPSHVAPPRSPAGHTPRLKRINALQAVRMAPVGPPEAVGWGRGDTQYDR
jgi:hypothetical protein